MTTEQISPSAAQIREAGLRLTPQRLAVLDYLLSTDCHPTADEVGQAVNARLPTVSRASIYNVLHSLAEVGLVRKVVAGNAVKRYDAKTTPHHHFVCDRCGVVKDVQPTTAGQPPPRLPGASIERCEVVYHGRCADCVNAS